MADGSVHAVNIACSSETDPLDNFDGLFQTRWTLMGKLPLKWEDVRRKRVIPDVMALDEAITLGGAPTVGGIEFHTTTGLPGRVEYQHPYLDN